MNRGSVVASRRGRAASAILMTALAAPSALAADGPGDMAPVAVDGIILPPAGDLRDREGRFEVHPKVLLGAGWNSRPLAPDGDGSDASARGLAGLLVRYLPREGFDAAVDGEIERLRYRRNPVLDTTAGTLTGVADYVAPELSWHADGGWTRSQEALLLTGDEVVQDLYRAGGRILHDSPGWWEQVDGSASYLNYRQPTGSFDEDQGDHATYDLGVRLGRTQGDGRLFASVRAELVRYRTQERFNDCTAGTATIGGSWAVLARTTLHAEAGGEIRRYADDYLHDPANDDRTAIAPWADLGGSWSWRDGNHLGASVFSDLGDGLTSNAFWSVGARLDARVQASDRLALEADLRGSQGRDGGVDDRTASLERRIYQADAAAQYLIAEGLAVRLEAALVAVRSSGADAYRRTVLGLAIAYAY